MASSIRSLPSPKFSQGETVLCYEPDLSKSRVLYEAKVIEVDVTKDEKGKKVPEYFIHFNGWNKSWDRWVLEDQVLKNSDANRALKAKLHEQASKFRKKRKQRNSLTLHNKSDDAASNTAKSDSEENNGENADQPKVEIEIPSQLKLKLEDDCYFIKRKKKLVQLPRSPCVDDVVEEYYKHYMEINPEASGHLVRELMDGLKTYFNFTLPTLLLYNFEREQFRNIMQITATESTTDAAINQNDNVSLIHEEKCSIVSSTTESSVAVTETSSSVKEKDSKRNLRRRPLRRNAVQNDHTSQMFNNEYLIEQPHPQANQSDQPHPQANQSDQPHLQANQSDQPHLQANLPQAEESQSATVSSTSSPQEVHVKLSTKRKVKDIEEESEVLTNIIPPGPCCSPSIIAAFLPASCKTLPSKIYGPEHLLRLFVKLPGLLGRTDMPEANLTALLDHVDLFLRYLVERSNALFPEDVYQSFL